jgi:beta-glucanase (GH16 family)
MSAKRSVARRRRARFLMIAAGVLLVAVLTPTIRAVIASTTAPVPSTPTVTRSGSGSQSGPAPRPWHLTFEDEFNEQQLNTDKWQPNWQGHPNSAITNDVSGSYELSCFDPAQVTVSGGPLILTALHQPCTTESGATYQYDSGLVNTLAHYTFTYGFLEAKIWVPTSTCGSGDIPEAPATCVSDFPTFWASGVASSSPEEIDVMEGLQGLACFHFHYNDPSVSDPNFGGCPTLSQAGGWHVYAADWEPGRVTYYYDGENVGTITSPLVPNRPMYLILSLGIPALWTDQTSASLQIAYVRVWQH